MAVDLPLWVNAGGSGRGDDEGAVVIRSGKEGGLTDGDGGPGAQGRAYEFACKAIWIASSSVG